MPELLVIQTLAHETSSRPTRTPDFVIRPSTFVSATNAVCMPYQRFVLLHITEF